MLILDVVVVLVFLVEVDVRRFHNCFDYVDWMWHGLSTDSWSGSQAQESLRCQLYFD